MSKQVVGAVVVGETITLVHAEVPNDANDPIVVIAEDNWSLQSGDRGPALSVLYLRCQNFIEQNNVDAVIIKASALPQNGVKLSVLHSAEVRGVMLAASASKTKVDVLSKAKISKGFGTRKADEYLKDDAFWATWIAGVKLKKFSREAALLILASR